MELVDLDKLVRKAREKETARKKRQKRWWYIVGIYVLAHPLLLALLLSGAFISSTLGAYWGFVAPLLEEEDIVPVSLAFDPPPPEEELEEEEEEIIEEEPEPSQEPEANTIDDQEMIDMNMLSDYSNFGRVFRQVAAPKGSGVGLKAAPPAPSAPPPIPMPQAPILPPVNESYEVVQIEDFLDYRRLNSTLSLTAKKDVSSLVKYPEVARRGEVQGRVVLEHSIDVKGKVQSVKSLNESGIGLNKAAEEGLSEMEYEPVQIEGVSMEVRNVPAEIRFNLD